MRCTIKSESQEDVRIYCGSARTDSSLCLSHFLFHLFTSSFNGTDPDGSTASSPAVQRIGCNRTEGHNSFNNDHRVTEVEAGACHLSLFIYFTLVLEWSPRSASPSAKIIESIHGGGHRRERERETESIRHTFREQLTAGRWWWRKDTSFVWIDHIINCAAMQTPPVNSNKAAAGVETGITGTTTVAEWCEN